MLQVLLSSGSRMLLIAVNKRYEHNMVNYDYVYDYVFDYVYVYDYVYDYVYVHDYQT